MKNGELDCKSNVAVLILINMFSYLKSFLYLIFLFHQ